MRYLNGTLCKSAIAAAAFAGALLAQAAAAQAQSWPTRAVKFIVPFGPGAGADIGGRLFADKLSQKWGQPVVIENKPGGDSIVAITRVPRRQRRPRAAVRAVRQFHRASVRLQQADLQSGRSDPDRARLQHHPRARGEEGRALQHHEGVHRGRRARRPARSTPGWCRASPNSPSGAIRTTRSCRSRRCRIATSTWRRSISAKAASRW